MMDTQTCATLLAGDFNQLYAFFKSDAGQLFVLALGTAKAAVKYCARSSYPEARDLASAIVVGSALLVLIAAQEAHVPKAVKQILTCKGQEMPAGPVFPQAPGT